MKKAGLFKPAFLVLNTEKLFLEFVLYGQACPGNVVVGADTFGAGQYSRYLLFSVILKCNLVPYSRGEGEIVAEVKVG